MENPRLTTNHTHTDGKGNSIGTWKEFVHDGVHAVDERFHGAYIFYDVHDDGDERSFDSTVQYQQGVQEYR